MACWRRPPRCVWDHTLDLGVMDGLLTTQAAKEYLAVGVTTASAGGMPSAVANCGLLKRPESVLPARCLFPLFEEVGEACLVESARLSISQKESGCRG